MTDNEAIKAHIEKALDESRRATTQLEAAMSKVDHPDKFRDDVAYHLTVAAGYVGNAHYYIERAQSI